MKRVLGILLALLAMPLGAGPGQLASVPLLEHRVIDKRAHDAMLFTQGMLFDGDRLVESGGGYGDSRLLVRTLEQRSPEHATRLPAAWFGEGIALHGRSIVMLTWREGIAQEYSLPALQPLRRFRYTGEGWGLTSDGTSFIQSDGSARLVWRATNDFRTERTLEVTVAGKPLALLNELEWVDGWVLANVYGSDAIVLIDPANGVVRARLDLAGLLSKKERNAVEVLNGIAWHAASRTLWVSGKRWPWMFGLRFELPAP